MDPQIIKTDAGEELVILSRREYDRLLALGNVEHKEDAGTAHLGDRFAADLVAGRETVLPDAVARAIAGGANSLRIVRQWRGETQAHLAGLTGIPQGTISALERGARHGTVDNWRLLSGALNVPIELLLPD